MNRIDNVMREMRDANFLVVPDTLEALQTLATSHRRPDCVTEIRMGNTVLTVSGYFKQDTTDTAADKMAKVLEAESRCQISPGP